MNPYTPTTPGEQPEEPLEQLVAAAQDGDADALARLVRAVHDRIYRLALRMTARPPDAEDATQEILIRIITRLATYRGEAAFTTWAHRIAVNYLLDRSKNCLERTHLTFDRFAADLLDGLSAGPSTAPDADLLTREVQLACTHAVLTCLDREHRIAYILGDIIGVTSDDGAYICDVPAAIYRKRLSRPPTGPPPPLDPLRPGHRRRRLPLPQTRRRRPTHRSHRPRPAGVRRPHRRPRAHHPDQRRTGPTPRRRPPAAHPARRHPARPHPPTSHPPTGQLHPEPAMTSSTRQ